MTTVTISASSESGWVKVFVDGNEVLSGTGMANVSLDEGTHFLTYFVQGIPGSNYQISITDPPDEIWQVSGKLKSNHTTGQHAITI
jgi:hypothetical protein